MKVNIFHEMEMSSGQWSGIFYLSFDVMLAWSMRDAGCHVTELRPMTRVRRSS